MPAASRYYLRAGIVSTDTFFSHTFYENCMSTFQEIQSEYKAANDKKAVLLHLIEYLDTNFRTSAGSDPKQTLLNNDKVAVPETVIEAVVAEILTAELEQLGARISQIEQSTIAPPAPPAPAPVTENVPPAEETVQAPRRRRAPRAQQN